MLRDLLEEVTDAHKSETAKERPESCTDKYTQSHLLGTDLRFRQVPKYLGGRMYFTNTDLNHRHLVRKAAAFGDTDGRAIRLHQDSPDPSTEPVSAFSAW